MELMNRIRKSRKGFTLVEIIVVLVILAVLAAFTIPAMLGFVEDAKGKAYLTEAREVYSAAQATATEYSASVGLADGTLSTALSSPAVGKEKGSTPTAAASVTDATKASIQMGKYIGADLSVYDGAVPTAKVTFAATGIKSTDSAWTITVGAAAGATTTTAAVTEIVYFKNNYQVTIADDVATVEKLK